MIGESALLSEDRTRSADIVAADNSEVLILNEERLQKLIRRHKRLAAKFAYNMVCMLSNRLEATTKELH